MRSSGSRSSTLSWRRWSSAPRRRQKKPPLIQCSERGFSRKPVTRPSPSSSVTPNCSAGRTTVMLASPPCAGVKGQQRGRGRCRRPVGVGRAERLLTREPVLQQLEPPAGRRVQTGVHALDAHAGGPIARAGCSARSARPCSRSPAGSGESPERRRARSHARRSARRRSRRAAWGSPGCAPAGVCHDRRRGYHGWLMGEP